jgi:class III poly(R)-hydroxyalkanoic acid synthase PhaE subunit
MASDSNAPGDWAAAMQKAQADLLRQWSEISQAAMRTGTPPAAASPGSGAPAEALARQFMQQCEQYLGVSRSLWDLVTHAAAVADPEQRARFFTDGVGALQQQFAQLWAAGSLATPAAAGFAGWPGAAMFGAGSPAMGAVPGFGGIPGMGGIPGLSGFPGMSAFPGMGGAFSTPALGPAREQQESLQRFAQLGMRCAHAQMQVSAQWNDIIGKALRELAERLAPRLKSGATPASMKEVYDLWVDSAESVYAQAARAGAFVQAQAELTNATSLLRSAQRELLEEWARKFDLPTRSELNSIHQQLRDLKAALMGTRG